MAGPAGHVLVKCLNDMDDDFLTLQWMGSLPKEGDIVNVGRCCAVVLGVGGTNDDASDAATVSFRRYCRWDQVRNASQVELGLVDHAPVSDASQDDSSTDFSGAEDFLNQQRQAEEEERADDGEENFERIDSEDPDYYELMNYSEMVGGHEVVQEPQPEDLECDEPEFAPPTDDFSQYDNLDCL